MKGVTDLLLGYRDFYSEQEIQDYVRHSRNYDPGVESQGSKAALLIFDTSRQHTWLVATVARLYCILDDVRKKEPHINWSTPRNVIMRQRGVSIKISIRPRTDRTGLLDIGEHKSWLYSHHLFGKHEIKKAIYKILEDTMSNAGA